jgi:hypothetical protein
VNAETRREAGSETVRGLWSSEILIAPDEIARGASGDCCILCGLVSIDLPPDQGCKSNIDVEAYRNRRRLVSDWGQRPQAPIAAHDRRAV